MMNDLLQSAAALHPPLQSNPMAALTAAFLPFYKRPRLTVGWKLSNSIDWSYPVRGCYHYILLLWLNHVNEKVIWCVYNSTYWHRELFVVDFYSHEQHPTNALVGYRPWKANYQFQIHRFQNDSSHRYPISRFRLYVPTNINFIDTH